MRDSNSFGAGFTIETWQKREGGKTPALLVGRAGVLRCDAIASRAAARQLAISFAAAPAPLLPIVYVPAVKPLVVAML